MTTYSRLPKREPVMTYSRLPKREPVMTYSRLPKREPVMTYSRLPKREPVMTYSRLPKREPVTHLASLRRCRLNVCVRATPPQDEGTQKRYASFSVFLHNDEKDTLRCISLFL